MLCQVCFKFFPLNCLGQMIANVPQHFALYDIRTFAFFCYLHSWLLLLLLVFVNYSKEAGGVGESVWYTILFNLKDGVIVSKDSTLGDLKNYIFHQSQHICHKWLTVCSVCEQCVLQCIYVLRLKNVNKAENGNRLVNALFILLI